MLILISIFYGIGFDASESFLLSDGSGFGKNVIFVTDESSLVHIDNKKKGILILVSAY